MNYAKFKLERELQRLIEVRDAYAPTSVKSRKPYTKKINEVRAVLELINAAEGV